MKNTQAICTWSDGYPLSSSFISVAKIIIEIADCQHSSSVIPYGGASNVFNHYSFEDTVVSPSALYDMVVMDSVNYQACGSNYITSILPNPVRAGVNDTVTIKGKGFEALRGDSGNVFIRSADNGGASFIHLDSMDYVPGQWNDTLIKFVLPSTVDSIDGTTNYPKGTVPGSGSIKIKTNSSVIIGDSTNYLKIEYAINSEQWPNGKRWIRLLSDFNNLDTGAIYFRPDTSFSRHPDRLLCLQMALRQWRCATGINLMLGPEIERGDTIYKNDTISVISFGHIDDTTLLARTTQYRLYSQPPCDIGVCREVDLFINDSLINRMWADTTAANPQPNNMYDLYHILLHELGHSISLGHINDTSEIMYWRSYRGPISSVNRKIDLINCPNSINGGYFVKSESENITNNNQFCAYALMKPGAQDCTGTPWIGISEINSEQRIKIYPNPNSIGILSLTIDADKLFSGKVTISDYLGKQIITQTMPLSIGLNTYQINIEQLVKGYYLLNANSDSFQSIYKLIIQ